jgi:hypothetical protein
MKLPDSPEPDLLSDNSLFEKINANHAIRCCSCTLFFAFLCLFLTGAYYHSATHMVVTWMPC